jgi:pyruvate/2-oxoglutarate/acetoin dehydrogenase E1 component
VVDECPLRCGIASEVAGTVAEHGFDLLKAPIQRVTRAQVPAPYSAVLEAAVTPPRSRRRCDACSACDDDVAVSHERLTG